MTLGSRQSGAATAVDLQYIGSMSDVAVYNYALSAAQVWAHFAVLTNRPPQFAKNPVRLPNAYAGQYYAASLTATDPNADALTYAKISGPDWLAVASNGGISGTPFSGEVGGNAIQVSARDAGGLSASTLANIQVEPAPAIYATYSFDGSNMALDWTGGIAPYQVQVATNLVNPAWQSLGSPLNDTHLSLSPARTNSYYRIGGQ